MADTNDRQQGRDAVASRHAGKEGSPADRAGRKVIQGIVVSDKASKTRVIDVQRRVAHRFYEKVMTKRSRFYAHDEKNESHEGDLVEIMSTRPYSRLKRWRIVRVIKTGQKAPALPDALKAEVPAQAPSGRAVGARPTAPYGAEVPPPKAVGERPEAAK